MNEFSDNFLPQLDFPEWHGGASQRVMFASIPRAGSTFICELFWRTGQLGAPLEYANFKLNPDLKTCRARDDFSAYWKDLERRRTSPNGVFSFKMFTTFFGDIHARFDGGTSCVRFDDVIYIYRENVLDQAISYSRAIQTRRWFKSSLGRGGMDRRPVYDFKQIIRSLQRIREQTAIWAIIFKHYGIRPVFVKYEDVLADPSEIVRVFDALSIPCSVRTPAPEMVSVLQQRDQITEEWRGQFLFEVCRQGRYGDLITQSTLPLN